MYEDHIGHAFTTTNIKFTFTYTHKYIHAYEKRNVSVDGLLLKIYGFYAKFCTYRSIPGKHSLPGTCKRPCTVFLGVNVAASIQTYGN